MMFLQLVAGGHLLLFVTRTRNTFWMPPYPNAKLFWAVVATQIAAVLMCGFGWLVPALPWTVVGWVWVYNLVWMVRAGRRQIGRLPLCRGSLGAARFVSTLQHPLDAHGGLHHRRRRFFAAR